MSNDVIIIKKKNKKHNHGGHGGAWKVAYADFVTAMMAFFLLLWLLSATPAENLQGLAEYFSPTVGLKDRMGIGFKGGKAAVTEGVSLDKWGNRSVLYGAPPKGPTSNPIHEATESSGDGGDSTDAKMFSLIQTDLQNNLIQQQHLIPHINFKIMTDGLVIEFTDTKKGSLFKGGSSKPTKIMEEILKRVAKSLQHLPNYISIVGHTNSIRFSTSTYTNWDLSIDRANETRKALIKHGVNPLQFLGITGKADQEPLNMNNRNAPENRRINLYLMKRDVLPGYKKAVPDGLID